MTSRTGKQQQEIGERLFVCGACRAHLADYDAIVSKTFQGRFGRAYLASDVVNVKVGMPTPRVLITGMHTVADISCANCNTLVGWCYIAADDDSQKYKEGKYVLEKTRIIKENGWTA